MNKHPVYTSEQLADDIMRWGWRDSFREENKKAIIEMFEMYGRHQVEYALNPQSRPGFIGSAVIPKHCDRCGKPCSNDEFYVIVANKNYCPNCYFMAEKGIEISNFEALESLRNFNASIKNNFNKEQ